MTAPHPASRSTSPLPAIRDFPDWVPPMLVKELRQALKTRGFVLSMVTIQLVLMAVFASGLAAAAAEKSTAFVGAIFWIALFALFLVISPTRALGDLHGERQAKTLELLAASGISGTRVALGKWLCIHFQNLLILASLLPYFVLRHSLGSLDLRAELLLLFLCIACSSVWSAGAIAASGTATLTQRVGRGLLGVQALVLFTILMNAMGSGSVTSFLSLSLNAVLVISTATIVLTVLFLRLAGDCIDSPSENAAALPRILLLLAWIPSAFLSQLHASTATTYAYLLIATFITLVVFLWFLKSDRPVQGSHLSPFHRFGPLARAIALPLLPNWAGSLWLPLLPVAGFAVAVTGHRNEMLPAVSLCAASLYLGVLLWRLFFPRIRDPRIVLILTFLLGILLASLNHSLQALPPSVGFCLLPPAALLAYLKLMPNTSSQTDWLLASSLALLVLASLCLLLAFLWLRASPVWRPRPRQESGPAPQPSSPSPLPQ
ncbi:MAG: hypothetical protein RLZZ142_2096 [Verrucomicrobiota bacterium]|jgi:hypothetical protein